MLCGWRKQIDDYQSAFHSAQKTFANKGLSASFRGSGRILVVTSGHRSIELSGDMDAGCVFVEYWNSTNESHDHECSFHTYEAATIDAIQWLHRNCILDVDSSCTSCDFEITLRQWLDNANYSMAVETFDRDVMSSMPRDQPCCSQEWKYPIWRFGRPTGSQFPSPQTTKT